jgi:hydrophobic/amphiphilic exporter-1 (mainly G- bacteria), HAE1 family
MNIAHGAVTRPVTVTMRIAALVLLGAICLLRLPVDLLPKVSLPTVAVITTWPNVAPEEIESQVTRPLEESVSSASNVYEIDSNTVEGSSLIRVQFQWGTDIGQAAVDVLQLVERARQAFPTDPTLETPVVFKFDPSQLPILIFGVSGMDDPVKLRTLLDNQVSPIIESVGGVASAVATGGQERAIIVDVDPTRLQAHNASLNDVIRRIANENINLPAGIAKQSETEYTIRSLGWVTSPDQLGKVPLGFFNGQLVKLHDVANVRDSHSETRVYTRFNGQPAVGLIIVKQSEANTVSTAQGVLKALDRVHQLYPDLKFGVAYNQAEFIKNSINDVKTSAVVGGFLAILILLFFLRNVRSTLVVALSIPTSIISTFALLYMCGFTINTMSLGGLALSTGLIVDDAVVVLENIFRHMERDKKSAFDAAIEGTNEILSAVFASTWTIMVVFLPLLFIKGQAGQMFTQFAVVVIFALAISLLDAATVVPMLATRLVSGEAHAEMTNGESTHRGPFNRAFRRFGKWFDAMDQSYRRALDWALRHRFWTLAAVGGITGASLLLAPRIGVELMPQSDSGDFTVRVKMPVGTSLAVTNQTMLRIEQILAANPNVATAFSAAGTTLNLRGSTTQLVPFEGSATVKLKDDRSKSTIGVIGDLRREFARLPGARALPQTSDLVSLIMTGGVQNVEVDIFGEDLAILSGLAAQVEDRLRGIVGYENIDVNWEESMPEVQWVVDRDKANELGLSFADVANTINTATNGTIASYYQEKGFQYPIIVQMPEATRKTVPDMLRMIVNPSGGSGGTVVPSTSGQQFVASSTAPRASGTSSSASGPGILLSQVANPVYGAGPSQITRLDRQRYIAVTGSPQGRAAGDIQKDIEKVLADFRLPTGYYWDWGTTQKRRSEEFSGMGLAIVLAIGLIYMLLAAQFEAFLHPLTILLSVPLAATGVILALFLTGRTFGLTAFIGALMLVGIVVKNGILLVDYTNLLRKRGMPRTEALLAAGPTRLRPILMTASAAVLGMLPLASGIGRGSEIQAPMATAVIGGLTTSTFLTLLVVPVVYSLLDDLAHLFHRERPT